MENKIKIAFVKFGGLASGSSEQRLQTMAARLPRDRFEVDYYYCDAAPYLGSPGRHSDTDEARLRFMQDNQVNLVKFHVGAKDVRVPTHEWRDTDFWDVFQADKYDFVQTVKGGHTEYPYYLLPLPVIEVVGLNAGVDLSPNLVFSIHPSQWQRRQWCAAGGPLEKSTVIQNSVNPFRADEGLRSELHIAEDALIAGFHQRVDDYIFSDIPLAAWARIQEPNHHFVVMGGSSLYREQARALRLENIHFLEHSGSWEAISRFLKTLDVYAHGRRDGETFGTVIAEALAHGVPCISHSSFTGNNAQIETMGPAGIFVDDLDDYSDGLSELLANARLRHDLGSKGRRHAETYYSEDSCIAELVRLYEHLSARTPGPFRPQRPSYGYLDTGFLYAGEPEPGALAHYVASGGIPEEFEVHLVSNLLDGVRTFIDVGANTGLYCLIAANLCSSDAQIHAFEPQIDCCENLKRSLELNGWEDRVQIHPLGLADEPGTQTLRLSGTGSTLDPRFAETADEVAVPVDTMDAQMAAIGIEPACFVKIDVEGLEYRVLKGAQDTISAHRPVMLIELANRIRHTDAANPDFAKALTWLQERKYDVRRCSPNGRLTRSGRPPSAPAAMYLCIPKEKSDQAAGARRAALQFRRSLRRRRLLRFVEVVKRVSRPFRRPSTVIRKARMKRALRAAERVARAR